MLRSLHRLALAAALCLVFAANFVLPASARSRICFKIVYGGFAVTTGGNLKANPAFIKIHGTAVGHDDLLGLSTAAFDQTVVFSNPNQIEDGRFVFSAADASSLSGTYHGPTSIPNARGLSGGFGTFVITRGTGRFRGVAGNGTYTVFAQLFPPGSNPAASVQTTFEGELER